MLNKAAFIRYKILAQLLRLCTNISKIMKIMYKY